MSDVLKAMLDFKAAFPNMSWHLDGDVLVMQTWLVEGEAQVLRDAQELVAPVDDQIDARVAAISPDLAEAERRFCIRAGSHQRDSAHRWQDCPTYSGGNT